MTDEELEKKAEHYADEHFADTDECGFRFSDVAMLSRAYIAGAKELQEENHQLKKQLENEKQLNAEIKKRLVEVEYDCEEFNHEYCDPNCNGKRKETIDLLQLISDGLNKTLLKQKDEELKQEKQSLAKRMYELQSDLSRAKSQIEKMKCCENCKYHSFWGDELKCNYGMKEALQEDKLVKCEDMNKWEIFE